MNVLVVTTIAFISIQQVVCYWAGTGRVQCYGYVTCTLQEWDSQQGPGPQAMFFKPETGEDFDIWAWDYVWNGEEMPSAQCNGDIWYQDTDMGGGWCDTNREMEKEFNGCG